jgi:ABC-type multidrug transport system ATPase subunit
MTGLLRIVDGSGERDAELSRGRMTLGTSRADALFVKGDGEYPSLLSLNWDPRRATWTLYCPLPLAAPVIVNRRAVAPGEQIPMTNLDVIELPGAFLQFQRLLAPPLRSGRPTDQISLDSQPLVIGRGDPHGTVDSARVDLDSEEIAISRVHAMIEREGEDYFLTDRSRLGTELNGVAFTRERLVFGDRLRISGYIFEFTGDALRLIHPESSGTVSADTVTVLADGRRILDQVSLNIAAGEFVGVLGGSGHGKTTLLNALCGINPPTSGEVRLGGVPLTDRARLREIGIGYVPQDDIVHRELTVNEAITFSAKLRLRLPRPQIDALVSRITKRLGLAPHAHQRVADLSGGQRKRVSIAIELLAKPSILFLDEPSSGLDPANEEALMTLLQSLTLTKLTVVCTTHVLQKAYLFDRILVVQSGKLIFAGDSDDARRHFLLQTGAEDQGSLQHSPLERIYGLLANSSRSASDWEVAFRRSPFAARAVPPLPRAQLTQTRRESPEKLRVNQFKTFLLLAARQWKIIRSDFLNIAFLLVQPLLIGLLIGWVADKLALRMFLCIVATMWFGCSNGAQQIVGELPIFRRERVSGQGLNAYVLSKLGFLSAVSLAQAILLLFVTLFVTNIFHPEELDVQNIGKEFAARLAPIELSTGASGAEGDFDAVDADEPAANAASTSRPEQSIEKTPWQPNPLVLGSLMKLAGFFQISQNVLDSGPRILSSSDGTPLLDSQGRKIIVPGKSILNVLLVTLGLRFFAVAMAALTGVSIGLTISSIVTNTTQAVLWVPLVLIPQILFGGVVVTVPDMSKSVRAFSHLMPSFAAQRIMDTAALYGLTTPFLTNRTKTPLFLTSRGEKETIEWKDADRSFSQSYDKLSPVNMSWQNIAVIPGQLGQHKQAGDRSADGFHIEYRDTIESRHDVRFSKGTPFWSLQSAQINTGILIFWNVACYGIILLGLVRKQTGK